MTNDEGIDMSMGKSTYGGDTNWVEIKERMVAAVETGELQFVPAFTDAVKPKTKELPDFTVQVNAGAAWLDEVSPGWDTLLDLQSLDLDDQNMCVLGQTWNHYSAMRELQTQADSNFQRFLVNAFDTVDMDLVYKHAYKRGFALSPAVYYWINTTGNERYMEAMEIALEDHLVKGGNPVITPVLDHLSFIKQIEASAWEQLTLTWVTLIQARQQVAQSRRMPARSQL